MARDYNPLQYKMMHRAARGTVGVGEVPLIGLIAFALSLGAEAFQKPVVSKPFRVEGRGAVATFQELWQRSDVVVEGVIAGARPADYMLRDSLLIHTMYDVRVPRFTKPTNM
jgi:hypothetical protein